jgi:hypothetical protein
MMALDFIFDVMTEFGGVSEKQGLMLNSPLNNSLITNPALTSRRSVSK